MPQAVHELFRSARKATAERAAIPAGPGTRHKGEFALALAARIAEASKAAAPVTVPAPLGRIFEFLYPPVTPAPPSAAVPAPEATTEPQPASADGPVPQTAAPASGT